MALHYFSSDLRLWKLQSEVQENLFFSMLLWFITLIRLRNTLILSLNGLFYFYFLQWNLNGVERIKFVFRRMKIGLSVNWRIKHEYNNFLYHLFCLLLITIRSLLFWSYGIIISLIHWFKPHPLNLIIFNYNLSLFVLYKVMQSKNIKIWPFHLVSRDGRCLTY